jgi:Holliday junction DNA helicase RuvA
MIAQLSGILEQAESDGVIIDVRGVGYLVFCSAATQRALPARGEPITLKIDTHVREDHIHLYGFATNAERAWFRALLGVQGVGTRVCLSILSAMTPALLGQAVAAQDEVPFTQASGVGPKLAKRIVGELRDAAPTLVLDAPRVVGGGAVEEGPGEPDAARDAISALVNLGYGRTEAFAAVTGAVGSGDSHDAASLIRGGLLELGR